CVISNNVVNPASTSLDGGGINNNSTGAIVIDSSTISGNVSGDDGGAIYQFSSAKLAITNSTLSGNTARFGEGGAIYLFSSYVAGSVIRNCTISGNTSEVGGGGLGWRSASGTFPIQNSTITANTAGANKYVTTGGGGVAVISGAAGNFSLESSIVAGN